MTTRDTEQSYSSIPKVLTETDMEQLNKQNSRLVTDFTSLRLEKDAKKHWDYFYKRNENRFFKDRHWILREFPELEGLKDTSNKRSILEVGCGVGNLFYPLIEEGLQISVHACDFSQRAIGLVKQHPLYDAEKINAFQADLTEPHCLDSIGVVDMVTMVFVLSAIHPEKFAQVLRNIFTALKPGGVLLFRDYGLYDMTQIRFKPGHKIADNFYMRQDGTRSYFFTTSEVEKLFRESGFHVLSNQYVNRRTVNLKEEVDVPRIYVQAKFQKPG